MSSVRQPAVAGAFYPDDPRALAGQVRGFLQAAPSAQIPGRIAALISPHAGYLYSGGVAAHAYKLVQGKKYEAVIVVAPSHRVFFQGASIYTQGAFKTPLGLIPIHQELAEKIKAQDSSIQFLPKAHDQEHSLEVQLPFLQTVLGDYKLIPIVQGSQDLKTSQTLARAIAAAVKGKEVLLVASSDLSHYHGYDQAVALDKLVQDRINKFDPEGLDRDIQQGVSEACGAGPMVTVMLAARLLGAGQAQVLKYANSGDVTGDKGRVVGYLAAALYASPEQAQGKPLPAAKPNDKADAANGLTQMEKDELLRIARITVEKNARGEKVPKFEPLTPLMGEKRGAFVTLKKNHSLRGCIGYIQAIKPLYQTIQEMAYAAAFSDSRFTPVTADELAELEYEISVLTPLKRINSVAEIQVGICGLYIRQGFYSGLLLPQVATENDWDLMMFIQQTCRKAGLPPSAWQHKDSEMYIFSADIF